MDICQHIKNASGIWRGAPPASMETIEALVTAAPIELPDLYLKLLSLTNGGEGDLGIEPGWFVPWPAEEVLHNNQEYGVHEYLKGYFGFGTNGSGEMLAFDARRSPPWPIVMVPLVGMDEGEAVQIAPEFESFAKAIKVSMEKE